VSTFLYYKVGESIYLGESNPLKGNVIFQIPILFKVGESGNMGMSSSHLGTDPINRFPFLVIRGCCCPLPWPFGNVSPLPWALALPRPSLPPARSLKEHRMITVICGEAP
jgi:hypothetical protein